MQAASNSSRARSVSCSHLFLSSCDEGTANATPPERRIDRHVGYIYDPLPSWCRQALTVASIALLLVLCATMFISSVTPLAFEDILFEAISAFSTVGLSTGITAQLPPSALFVLVMLMFVGRVGTITAATALALGSSERRYRYPEENPIVG